MHEELRKSIEAAGDDVPQELLDLAANAPRIPVDDPRAKTDEWEMQFGNNFYALIYGVRQKLRGVENFWGHSYLQKAERHGARWESFVKENEELLEEACDALDGLEPSSKLFAAQVELMLKDRAEGTHKAEQLNKAVGHPLGIDAVTLYAWDRLNPLLIEIAERLEKAGIDPKEFYA